MGTEHEGLYQTLKKWKSGCHSLSHFVILAAMFMVSRSHFGKEAGIPDRLEVLKATL